MSFPPGGFPASNPGQQFQPPAPASAPAPQPHPTVGAGLPPYAAPDPNQQQTIPGSQTVQGQPVQQGWQQPQVQSQQPWGQQPQLPPQQPMQQFQQAPAQQPQGTAGFNPNVILDGPGVPPELRGRTMAQVLNAWPQLLARAAQAPQPQSTQQQQPAPQPQRQQQPVPGQQPQRSSFWENPDAALESTVERVVQSQLAPITQQAMYQQLEAAQRFAQQQMPDYAVLQEEIIGALATMPMEQRTNPQSWLLAGDMARGKLQREGRYNFDPRTVRPPQNAQPAYGPGAAQPAVPMQPAYQFFTEAPTAPNFQPNGQLTQEQQDYARRFGIDPQTYAQWGQSLTIEGQR